MKPRQERSISSRDRAIRNASSCCVVCRRENAMASWKKNVVSACQPCRSSWVCREGGLIVPKKEGKQIFYRLRMTLSWKSWLSCIIISAADRKCENEYRLDRACRYERRTAAKPFHLAAETLHIGMDTTTTCSSRPIKPPTSVPLIRMNWRSFPIDSSSSLTIDRLSQFLTV